MKMLIRKHFKDKTLHIVTMTTEQWLDIIRRPIIRADKDKGALGIYGTLKESVKPSKYSPREAAYCADNIDSIYMLQLDYDNGVSIDEFINEHKDLSYVLYTSHSHGYKGNSDRFRVVIQLSEPLKIDSMGPQFKEYMSKLWGVDPTCFDRGHCQLVPMVRSNDSPYRWHINKGKHYEIPWNEINSYVTDFEKKCMFEDAMLKWNRKWYPKPDEPEPDEEEVRRRQMKWAENELSIMIEGSRNSTAFAVLAYLKRNEFDYDDVEHLSDMVDFDFKEEFDSMVRRMFR